MYAGRGGYQQPCPQSFSCVTVPALKELSVKFCKLLRLATVQIFSQFSASPWEGSSSYFQHAWTTLQSKMLFRKSKI